jgi:hypothetical protein
MGFSGSASTAIEPSILLRAITIQRVIIISGEIYSPPERAQRSLQVTVLDKNGHATKPGAEVRIFESSGGSGVDLVDRIRGDGE